jgi:hypothetical protein
MRSSGARSPGYLLFVREGTLLAQRFDAATLLLSGEPFALAGNVARNTASANASFSVSADGRVVAYRVAAERSSQVVWFDRGGAMAVPIVAEGAFQLAVHVSTSGTSLDVWVVPIDDRKPYEVAQTTFQELSASLSPDGRWIAFMSDESGAPAVYVQALGKAGKQRVSTSGGMLPRWRGDERELFFIDAANRLMAVAVGEGEGFVGSPPIALFKACGSTAPQQYRYDIAADGARSLWLCPAPRDAPSLVTVSVGRAAQFEARGR